MWRVDGELPRFVWGRKMQVGIAVRAASPSHIG
jgi:hypothetical protein